jgi:hypothetical protein
LNGGDDFALSRIELGDGHSGSIRLQAGSSYLLIQLAWGNRARRALLGTGWLAVDAKLGRQRRRYIGRRHHGLDRRTGTIRDAAFIGERV